MRHADIQAERVIICDYATRHVAVVELRTKDNLWRAVCQDKRVEDVATTVERAEAMANRMVGRR